MPKPLKKSEPELRPDGWDRFRLAVKAGVTAGPKHRKPAKKARKAKK